MPASAEFDGRPVRAFLPGPNVHVLAAIPGAHLLELGPWGMRLRPGKT